MNDSSLKVMIVISFLTVWHKVWFFKKHKENKTKKKIPQKMATTYQLLIIQLPFISNMQKQEPEFSVYVLPKRVQEPEFSNDFKNIE